MIENPENPIQYGEKSSPHQDTWRKIVAENRPKIIGFPGKAPFSVYPSQSLLMLDKATE